ncbi:MAG TPA: phage terminase large subunit, partial [Candidatus Angelobacter sp.]|nr:phage terminase large subunit [Candidatus Angelobacter sp.]
MSAQLPEKLAPLFEPARYKVAYGGRGGAKSWGFARALLILGAAKPLRIMCAREIQNSIAESVHALLGDQVKALGLEGHYRVL